MRRNRLAVTFSFAAILAVAVVGAGCSKDPCGAGVDWAKGCGVTATPAQWEEWEAKCPKALEACSDQQRADLADYYGCIIGKKACTSSEVQQSGCLVAASVSALQCSTDLE